MLDAIGRSLAGLLSLFSAIAMLSGSSLAFAADDISSTGADEQITVNGMATTKQQVSDFVGGLTSTRYLDQLNRFESPICPRVAGLSEANANAVAARMRWVAEAAGVRAASGDCRANILVIIAPDKAALIKAFAKKYPYFMTDLSRSKRKALTKSDSPAVVWHFQGAMMGPDGAEITEYLDGILVNRTTEKASHITEPVYPKFHGAVIVLESAECGWLSTTQLADYALLRTLLNADPENLPSSQIPTILNILEAKPGEEVPTSLTQWDLEAIRAYHSVNRVLPVQQQRSHISSQMLRKLAASTKSTE